MAYTVLLQPKISVSIISLNIISFYLFFFSMAELSVSHTGPVRVKSFSYAKTLFGFNKFAQLAGRLSENVLLFIAPRFVLLYLLDAAIFFRKILKKGVVLFSKSVLFLSVNLRLNRKFYLRKTKILLIKESSAPEN